MKDIIENFIVFEGIDKSGKTTQSKKLFEYFNLKARKVFLEREPSENEIGMLIRKELAKKNINDKYMALLFATDRCDHLYNEDYGILSKTRDAVVICDRYIFSSLAYQSLNIPKNFVSQINDFPLPEYLIYLDLPLELFENRMKITKREKEVFENKDVLKQVLKNYEQILNEYKNTKMKIIKINANQSEEDIFKELINFLGA